MFHKSNATFPLLYLKIASISFCVGLFISPALCSAVQCNEMHSFGLEALHVPLEFSIAAVPCSKVVLQGNENVHVFVQFSVKQKSSEGNSHALAVESKNVISKCGKTDSQEFMLYLVKVILISDKLLVCVLSENTVVCLEVFLN